MSRAGAQIHCILGLDGKPRRDKPVIRLSPDFLRRLRCHLVFGLGGLCAVLMTPTSAQARALFAAPPDATDGESDAGAESTRVEEPTKPVAPPQPSESEEAPASLGSSFATKEVTVPPVPATATTKKSLSHARTVTLGVAAGVGWGMTIAGDLYCGEFSSSSSDSDGRKSICTDRTPGFLDLTLGVGAGPRIDVVFGLRLNLEKRDYDFSACDSGTTPCDAGKGLFNDSIGLAFMPGVRLWGKDTHKVFKVGGAIDFMIKVEDFSGYRNRASNPDEDSDQDNDVAEASVGGNSMGLRGGPVIQIDPHHNWGIYIIPAVVPSVHIAGPGWFELGFEGSVGFQARFP